MLSGNLQVIANFKKVKTNDLTSPDSKLNYMVDHVFTNGAGANKAENLFSDKRPLALGANEELDLNGVLNDDFGAALTFTKVKGLLVRNLGTVANIKVGGAALNGFASMFGDATDILIIPPGGMIVLVAPNAAGYGVTDTTGDLLKVENMDGANPVDYDIIIIGETS